MSTLETSIDVNVPVNIAYNQWTQFETFPNFMHSVINVRQIDDTHVWWLADFGDQAGECEVEIIDQVPDDHIAWRSLTGLAHSGRVSFHHVGVHATRVHLALDFEHAEDAQQCLQVLKGRIGEDLDRFRQLLESRKSPTGGWRGHVSNKTGNAIRH